MPQPDETRHPFRGVTDLFSELSRMREVGTRGHQNATEGTERTHASAWVPATDIVVQGDDLVIRVELAGVAPGDVHLGLSHSILTISGNRKTELRDDSPGNFYVRERFYGQFRRSFTLPEATEPEQITAEFANGLVEIVVRGAATQSDGTRIEIGDRSSGPTTRTLS